MNQFIHRHIVTFPDSLLRVNSIDVETAAQTDRVMGC
jgi:hypothetical protein